MLKNIIRSTLLIIIVILTFFVVQHLKKGHLKKSIIKEIDSQTNGKYNISANIRRCTSNKNMSSNPVKILRGYKLIYEVNFDCSICLIDLKEIHDFYIKLSFINEIEFCLITRIKSNDYIKFYIDKSLDNYDLWIVQQKAIKDNIKLYLLDSSNNIIMAGDIIRYPFLKDEYMRRLKKNIFSP